MNEQNELTLKDLISTLSDWAIYLFSKWLTIFVVVIVFCILGALYAWQQKPMYTAEITFASENDAKGALSSYAGIAAQFGLDLGGSSGGAFEGENLMYFMGSNLMVEKALLAPLTIEGRTQLLVDYYLKVNEINKDWNKKPLFKDITFANFYETTDRVRDSIFQTFLKDITGSLHIEKVDKKTDIISVRMMSNNELFAKLFVEQLVSNVITYYTNYKSQKAKQNVALLQKQTDSVKNLLVGNITSIAVSNDLNVNPSRQVMRTGVQKKQVDMQVNGTLYAELAKNLELSKIALRRETPFMQIIDSPRLPLQKEKMGRLKGAIVFGFLGFVIAIVFFLVKRILGNFLKK